MLYYRSCMDCPYRAHCEKVGSFDKEIDDVVAALDDLALVDSSIEMKCHHLPHYCGEEISDYGLQEGYVDYHTLAKVVGATVLCNDIISGTEIEGWEQLSGFFDNEIFQFYVVPSYNVDLLIEVGETVFYNEELELYLWGITHYGTSWDYVLTDIKI